MAIKKIGEDFVIKGGTLHTKKYCSNICINIIRRSM